MTKTEENEESEDFEQKSLFSGNDKEWFGLVKTIVAISNTRGGIIKIEKLEGVNPNEFDTAKIDDKVNSFISPRIHNITTKKSNGNTTILIPNSPAKPHIFIKRASYKNLSPPPQYITEFYEGQIWVRHSGKNAWISKDDFDRMFKEKLDEFLKNINIIANQFPVSAKELKVVESKDSDGAMPIRLSESSESMPVLLQKEKVDPNIDFPYNAKEIGKLLNKNLSFIAKTTAILGLRSDMKYAIQLKNPQGKIIMVKYSNEALTFLKKFFSENPSFTPYKSEQQGNIQKSLF